MKKSFLVKSHQCRRVSFSFFIPYSEDTLKDKVDDEIRNLRHRIHHLLDERKSHCEYVLGINLQQQSQQDIYQQEMVMNLF